MGVNRRQRKSKGPRGKGDIRLMKSGEVRVYLDDGSGTKEVYPMPAPEGEKAVINGWKFQPIAGAFIELSEDEQEIVAVRPAEGTYYLVFDRFASRENMPPTIKHKEAEKVTMKDGRSWMNPPHDQFFAILKIVAHKDWAGVEIVRPLVYQFSENPAAPGEMEILYERKFWYSQLLNFLDVAGFDFDADTLARSANVLVELQEILKKRDMVFQGVMQNGYLNRELGHVPEGAQIKR